MNQCHLCGTIGAIEQAKSYKLERLKKRLNENKYED